MEEGMAENVADVFRNGPARMSVPALARRTHTTQRQVHAFLLTEDLYAAVGLAPGDRDRLAKTIAEESAANDEMEG